MWECGLKPQNHIEELDEARSLLMWEFGLKQRSGVIRGCPNGVTPYVGVWIETCKLLASNSNSNVTPYVGVWIETSSPVIITLPEGGHSLCGSVD